MSWLAQHWEKGNQSLIAGWEAQNRHLPGTAAFLLTQCMKDLSGLFSKQNLGLFFFYYYFIFYVLLVFFIGWIVFLFSFLNRNPEKMNANLCLVSLGFKYLYLGKFIQIFQSKCKMVISSLFPTPKVSRNTLQFQIKSFLQEQICKFAETQLLPSILNSGSC